MKIIVAHPGTQHSFRLADALKKENMLFKYMTTVYDKESSLLMKITKKLIKGDNLKRANGRKCDGLEDSDVIQFCEAMGLVELLILRVFKNKKLYFWIRKKKTDLFGKKVARYAIKQNVDMVIMYDTHELACFELLNKKAPHIKRVVDYSSATSAYMKKIYDEDIKVSKNNNILNEISHLCDNKSLNETTRSISLTHFFLVPSEFVKKSIEYYGENEKNIFIVPYGCNINKKESEKKECFEGLEFLYVGQVTYRKGVHHLIRAFNELNYDNIRLNIVGKVDSDSDIYIEGSKNKNIKFKGFVTHDRMIGIYENARVFILPSLSEGMSLSIIEAMGCNLPVICTQNSGVNGIVKDYENGFIIEPSNVEQLKEKITWFIENDNKIKLMGENAKKESLKYTWNTYNKNIVDVIREIIKVDCNKYQ